MNLIKPHINPKNNKILNIKLPIRHKRIIRKLYKKKTKKAQLLKVSQSRKTTHRLNIKATITTKRRRRCSLK